ncbi:MAG TPA: hypothetical protein PLM79_09585 [Syntrophobacteraceae bacterium]|nr:hypothetical protein [Syntrophobacteraceae bacterium]
MSTKTLSKGLTGLFIYLVALSASGCTTGYDLLDTGMGSIELVASRDRYAAITETELYQDGDCLLVTGSVEEISADFLPAGYDAHVDVAVLAPDRKVARKRSIRISLAEGVQSDFKVRFPYFAERGTVVRFAYHSDRRLADGAPNCGENAAVLHKSG